MSIPLGMVVAGTHSGVGKTSLALGIMGAFARRGHEVAPFKVGPDYIDPTYHASACGRVSRNLDTWLMPASEATGVFHRSVARAAASGGGTGGAPESGSVGGPKHGSSAVAVIEGVMGLFDGLAGGGERCSTAEVAKMLGLPVVLVVDCSHAARSVAAVVRGFQVFDPSVRLAGVILNKVAGVSHAAMVKDALAESLDAPAILGVVPRRTDLHLGSRHLGLIPTVEGRGVEEVLEAVIDHVEGHVDLDRLLECAAGVRLTDDEDARGVTSTVVPPRAESLTRSRVAVARDAAFSFYYEDNLDVLEEEGAEVVVFSPLAGEGLPSGTTAVYLGGGYPEVYAAELAANRVLPADLKEARAARIPVYAECGGYLYLGSEIETEAAVHPMAGLLPTRATMAGSRLRMGYVEACATGAHPLRGSTFRGHLFHYSATSGEVSRPAYRVTRKGESLEDGWAKDGIVASYVHLHFRGSRRVASWLASGVRTEEDTADV